MINEERKEALTGFLSGSRYTSLSEVFAAFPDISQSTIRRDLQSLASEGKVILLRGGVKLPDIKEVHDLPIKSKLMINTEAKKRMSYAAARMVRDGDVIYLDSSSSVYPLLRFLTAKDVTVVTTGIYTAVLAVSLGFRCETVGGEIRNSVGSVVGSVTEEELRQRHFSIAFMSSNGFSADTGISTPHAEEAAKIRIVRANSEKSLFLMDSGKMGLNFSHVAVPAREADIISDKECGSAECFASFTVAEELPGRHGNGDLS